MKLGILTLPLGANYGGILQNFALQQVLKSLGHESVTLQLPFPKEPQVGGLAEAKRRRTANLRRFMEEHLTMTPLLKCPLTFPQIAENEFDGFLVGSDQVWRPSIGLRKFYKAMFLDFLPKNSPALRIAYAASFGQVHWSFARKLLYRYYYGPLVRRFTAVSVREEIGQEYCQKFFKATPPVVLDPVLLATAEMYDKTLSLSQATDGNSGLFTYILDDSIRKRALVDGVKKRLGLEVVHSIGGYSDSASAPMPSVQDWLQGFKNARFVMTDSFHGTVLSLLFHKPFLAFVNASRGRERFISLLKPLGLEDRLLYSEAPRTVCREAFEIPDYQAIDKLLNVARKQSMDFLLNALGKSE